MIINKLRRKKILKEFQDQLDEERQKLEERLKQLTAPDEEMFSKMPDFGSETLDLNIEADQIEEIGNILALRQVLENNLKDISEASERIKNDTYGICQRCQKEIELRRLRIEPTATLCSRCVKKIEKLDEKKK